MGTDRVISEAIRTGRVSLHAFVRAALRGNPRLRERLERALRSTTPTRRSGVAARRARAAVAAGRRAFGRIEGVRSVHWGLRRRGGGLSEEAGIVVVVERKSPRADLPHDQHMPSRLRFRFRGRPAQVCVDVQPQVGVGRLHSGEIRPGDRGRVVIGGATGTLGGFVTDGGQIHAIVAGHVADHTGLAASAYGGSGPDYDLGRVLDVVLSDDVASCGPVPPAALALADDPAQLRDTDSNDVNTTVTVEVAWDPSGREAQVTDVDATGYFAEGPLSGLTALASQVTTDGDSGAPVRDYAGNVIGFVVGVSGGKTMLMPARRAINALG